MSAETFHLVIASVGESRFDGPVLSATVPASSGEMTVLARHEPYVTTLQKGTIIARNADAEERRFEIEGGVLEYSAGRAVVLL